MLGVRCRPPSKCQFEQLGVRQVCPKNGAALQVLDTCLAAGIPVAGYVGGGYSPDLDVLARRHCCLHRAAMDMWTDYCLT